MNRSHTGFPIVPKSQSHFQGKEDVYRTGQPVDHRPWHGPGKVSLHSCESKTFASPYDSWDVHESINFARIEQELLNIIDDDYPSSSEKTLVDTQILAAEARSGKVRSINVTPPPETTASFRQSRIDRYSDCGNVSPSGEVAVVPQECFGYLSPIPVPTLKPEIIESRSDLSGANGIGGCPNGQPNSSTDYLRIDKEQ